MAAVRGAPSAVSLRLCVLLLLLLPPAVTGLQSEDTECAFTDNLQGPEPRSEPTNEPRGDVRNNGTILCHRGARCFGLWRKTEDGVTHLVQQGCWTHFGDQRECVGDRCQVTATPSQLQNGTYRFCCCSRDLCNAHLAEAPPGPDGRQTGQQPLRREKMALVALVTVGIAAILIMALFLGYRMMRGKQKHTLSALDVMEGANTESTVDLDDLKLLELIGRGRYGAVFRGSLGERCVAAKLFSAANRQNFANECSIYRLPLLQLHANISHFLAADERTAADGQPELLIVMELYPHGCLSQYLSVHTVDWLTCCRMCHGATRGLSFLHTELHRGDQYKPAVAHRDVTSRNVLVRADLSCVLADFGLSMRLTGHGACCPGDDDTVAISEVGTVRYMAPEVLGGALNLRDCESALKQVDVYALGLVYWESFRRCSDLFPGEAVPEHQLPYQAELGNHPSFEEMRILVAREKHRPLFPDTWKENSPVLRSLKETMEDCWDQDAEARLTAQCAEERLGELTLLSSHTAIHNHRNLSHGRWTPQIGSASSYIEDLQVGVVKNFQPDEHTATIGGSEGAERNRNSINYDRQQSQARSSTSDALTSSSVLCSVSESEPAGGTVSAAPACLQLTEDDLEATKLLPKEVDKNVRETSDEDLMEHSQKHFGRDLLLHQTLHPQEANNSAAATPRGEPGGVGGVESPPSSAVHPLPKQQNLPQRPTSLHFLPKTKETPSASSRLKLGKLKSKRRQVETGVAKMNTVTVAAAVEPHLVTTVTNNTSTRGGVAGVTRPPGQLTGSYNVGVPTLVVNGLMGGGRTNPAGPHLEEEDGSEGGGTIRGGGGDLNLLNFSPDEHEPLLRREQPPAQSPSPPGPHRPSGRGSNSNNNNNSIASASGVKIQGSEVKPRRMRGSEDRGIITPEPPGAGHTSTPQAPPTAEDSGQDSDTGPSLLRSQTFTHQEPSPAGALRASPADPGSPVGNLQVLPVEVPAPETQSQDSDTTDLHEASAQGPGEQTRTRRPERPHSLDLSSSFGSSSGDDSSLSASGEKIKCRVKTPYTLKKWRPASWVVSTDTALDPDFDLNTGVVSPGPRRAGSVGVPKLNQSKSSMAVFLVGGGGGGHTAPTTSQPDHMTCF